LKDKIRRVFKNSWLNRFVLRRR